MPEDKAILREVAREIYELVGDTDAELSTNPNDAVQICRITRYGAVFESDKIQIFTWMPADPIDRYASGARWQLISEISLADPECFEKAVEEIKAEVRKIPC